MRSRKKTIIYIIGLVTTGLIFFINFFQHKIRHDAFLSDQTIDVAITKVSCNSYKSYVVFDYENSNHILNLTLDDCQKYHIGDSLNLFYNKQYNRYYAGNEKKIEK